MKYNFINIILTLSEHALHMYINPFNMASWLLYFSKLFVVLRLRNLSKLERASLSIFKFGFRC